MRLICLGLQVWSGVQGSGRGCKGRCEASILRSRWRGGCPWLEGNAHPLSSLLVDLVVHSCGVVAALQAEELAVLADQPPHTLSHVNMFVKL